MIISKLPTTSVSEPPVPPVVPPDDRNAPQIEREPSIDPLPTAPNQDAPASDPMRPPTPGWTT